MEAIQNSILSAEGLSSRGQSQRAFRLFLVTLVNLTHELLNSSMEFPINKSHDNYEKIKQLFDFGDSCLNQARDLCLYYNEISNTQERPFSMMEISPHLPNDHYNRISPNTRSGFKLNLPKIPPKSPSRIKSMAHAKLSSIINGNDKDLNGQLQVIVENKLSTNSKLEPVGIPLEMSKSTPVTFKLKTPSPPESSSTDSTHKGRRYSTHLKLMDFSPNELRRKLDAVLNPFSKRISHINENKDLPTLSTIKVNSNNSVKGSSDSSGPSSPVVNAPKGTLKLPTRGNKNHQRSASEESRISFAEIIKTASNDINFDFNEFDKTKKEMNSNSSPTNNTLFSPTMETNGFSFELDPEDLSLAKVLDSDNNLSRPISMDSINSLFRIPLIPRSPLVKALQKANNTLNEAKEELKELALKNPNNKEEFNDDKEVVDRLRLTISNSSNTLEKVSKLIRVDNSATFTFFPAALVAYQLTLIEWSIFKKIPKEALELHSAKNPYPQISISTDFFNYLTRMIELSILESEEKVDIIHFWIKCANKLLLLHNFQTLKAVLCALNTPPIKRLHFIWDLILKKDHQLFNSLLDLMGEQNNYFSYRHYLIKMGLKSKVVSNFDNTKSYIINKPTIPYLGVFIMDMTYLKAATKDDDENPKIQDTLNQFQAFLNGPEYSNIPPHRFIKSRKHQKSTSFSSFSSFSLNFGKPNSNNNHQYLSPRNSQSPLPFLSSLSQEDNNINPNKPLKDKETLQSYQYLITHFVLNQHYASDKMVDELSQKIINENNSEDEDIINDINGEKEDNEIINNTISIQTNMLPLSNQLAFIPSPVTPSNSTTLNLDDHLFDKEIFKVQLVSTHKSDGSNSS